MDYGGIELAIICSMSAGEDDPGRTVDNGPNVPPSPGLVPVPVRVIAAVVGAALVVTGAVAVFVTSNSAGAAALVTAGTVIGALAMFANRIQSVEGAGVKFEFQAVAAATARLRAARQAEQAGNSELAETLRDEAQLLMSAVGPAAAQYETVRRDEIRSWDRTSKLERVMRQIREMAKSDFGDPGSVERLFDSDTDGNRIAAIALMQANLSLASAAVTVRAIERPRSNFEQYHALRVAEAIVARDPRAEEAHQLSAVVDRTLQSGLLGPKGSDRRALAARILAMTPPTPPTDG
jgi:hypothetical protein